MKTVIIALLICLISTVCYADVPKVVIETLIYEGVGEGKEGMIKIAHVIQQRAKERGLSFSQVVLQPYQFSCNNDSVRLHKYSDGDYALAVEAWMESLNVTNTGANHYHAVYVYPYWADQFERIERVKKHIFYKGK